MLWREGHVLAKIVFLCLCLVTNPESQNQIFELFLRYFYGKPIIINYIELKNGTTAEWQNDRTAERQNGDR